MNCRILPAFESKFSTDDPHLLGICRRTIEADYNFGKWNFRLKASAVPLYGRLRQIKFIQDSPCSVAHLCLTALSGPLEYQSLSTP